MTKAVKADTQCPRCSSFGLPDESSQDLDHNHCVVCWGGRMVPAAIASAYSIATLGMPHGLRADTRDIWLCPNTGLEARSFNTYGCPDTWMRQ